jgi:tetratricopeptide (TPR) repeat protein
MRAIFRAGLLIPVREQDAGDARRTGVGLMRDEPRPRRSLEGRILEMQATAGNAAVGAYLNEADEGGGGGPIVQRDPIDGTQVGGAGTAVVEGSEGASGGDGVLRYGARGEEVKALQVRLNRVVGGRQKLAVDGIFGRRTQAAVRRFQSANRPLAVDGDAGPDTLAALDRAAPWTATDVDTANVTRIFDAGKALYMAGDYGRAYDEFTKAWEINGDLAVLWNRAQALRLAGGQREAAIRLYEQFLASNADADAQRSEARTHLEELRGPGRSGDSALDYAMQNSLHRSGTDEYRAGRFAQAYDEFTKAWEITGDPALLWNRAQSLRWLGGRRAEAIALFEQFIKSDADAAEAKKNASEHIAELRGPGQNADAGANRQAAIDIFEEAKTFYAAEDYVRAYDGFSKAYEIEADPAYLFNRAQALRLIGGRREEAIALYQQFLAMDIGDDARAQATERLTELRGPGRAASPDAGAGAATP